MPHNCNKNNWIMHEGGKTIFASTSEYKIGPTKSQYHNLRGIDLTVSPKLYVQKFITFASEWLSKYSTTFV